MVGEARPGVPTGGFSRVPEGCDRRVSVFSPSREPGVPPPAAARLAALAGREQGAEQPSQRFPLEPQPLLQDLHPSQLTGTPFRLPTRLLFHFIRRPLQPAPFHLPADPSERCVPGSVHLHPRLHRLHPAGREGMHQIPGVPGRYHEAGVLSLSEQHGLFRRSHLLRSSPHHYLPTVCPRIWLWTFSPQ